MTTYYPPLIYKQTNHAHQPAGDSEEVDPKYIPVSTAAENHIVKNSDGLYSGPLIGGKRVFYLDADDGVDAPDGGAKTKPLKTIGFCHNLITALSGGPFMGNVIVALKAGQTFPTNGGVFFCSGHITYTFWDDLQYGDFDGPAIAGTTRPAIMEDLSRPIIQVVKQADASGQSGIVFLPTLMKQPVSCTLMGVRVDLLGGSYSTGFVDFITSLEDSQSSVRLIGSIINMTDPTSDFGLYGIDASSNGYLYQYASQFLVQGQKVESGSTVAALTARKKFIKMYPDYNGNHQDGLQLYSGADGSGFLSISWSDITAMPVLSGKSNLATYPLLQEAGFGLGNYILNLNRDPHGRPYNVTSGRAF